MSGTRRDSARKLMSLAQCQGGYFTAKQAIEIGYDYPQIVYHVSAGNFERVGHGLYRLPTIPPSEHDDLVRLSFWSRNQKDEPQAVVSHESALVLHGLTELLPNRIQLTVPPNFRKTSPKECVLHKAKLDPDEVEEREGFRVTKPLRTLIDAANGDVSLEQIEKAIAEALERGLIQKSKLKKAAQDSKRLSLIMSQSQSGI